MLRIKDLTFSPLLEYDANRILEKEMGYMRYIAFLLAAVGATLSAHPMHHTGDSSRLCQMRELRMEQVLMIEGYTEQLTSMGTINDQELRAEVQAFTDFVIANDLSFDSYGRPGSDERYRDGGTGQEYEKCPYCNNRWKKGEPCPKPNCPSNVWKNRSRN